MRRRTIEPFCLIVLDRDQGVFSVEGPMTDDTDWIEAVLEAQKTGRDVVCSAGGRDRKRVEMEYAEAYGFKLVLPGSIVEPLLPRARP